MNDVRSINRNLKGKSCKIGKSFGSDKTVKTTIKWHFDEYPLTVPTASHLLCIISSICIYKLIKQNAFQSYNFPHLALVLSAYQTIVLTYIYAILIYNVSSATRLYLDIRSCFTLCSITRSHYHICIEPCSNQF